MMSKSSGKKDKAQGAAQPGPRKKTGGKASFSSSDDLTRLMQERDELRAQLAWSERRIKSLEDANKHVVKRLDAAIGTVKDMVSETE